MNQQTSNDNLLSLPNSLQNQLDRVQNLLTQGENAEYNGDHSLAMVKAREAMHVIQSIAYHSPEAATLAVLAEMGFRGFEYDIDERIDQYQVIPRTFLGITIGSDVVNVPTFTRRTVRGRAF